MRNFYMNKIYLLLISIFIVLGICACGKKNDIAVVETVTYDIIEDDDPFEIHLPDSTLVFYKEYVENDILPVVEKYEGFDETQNAVFIENNVMCTVCIWDDSIVTYKGISVGDDFEKVQEAFKYVYYTYQYNKRDAVYEFCVTLDIEDDYEGSYEHYMNEYITYNYLIKGDKVLAIEIEDNKFHKYY